MTAPRAIWLGLAILAATWSVALNVPLWLSALAFGCAILPPLIGTFMRGSTTEARTAELESALWIALATAGAASTGGGTAIMVLYAVAVAVAWMSGSARLTAEMAGFAVLGVILSVVAGMGGSWLNTNDAKVLATGYGIAGLLEMAAIAVLAAMARPAEPVSAPLKLVSGSNPDAETTLRLKQLETRLQQASKAAEEARIEADTARAQLDTRTTFFAQTSHELRTPLNAIIGFAEMMRNSVFGPLPDKYQEYAGLIHEGGRNLSLIVDDVIDLSRLDSGKFEITPDLISLTDVAAEAVRFMKDEAERKQIDLELAPNGDVEAFADTKAVRQIALNLISNGLKFTPAGGRVEVATLDAPNGGALLVVSDTGAGISPDELKRLSRAFEQGEAGKRQKGAGLGLSVVRAFAELHGGRLDIDSREGGGTTISVYFPPEKVGN